MPRAFMRRIYRCSVIFGLASGTAMTRCYSLGQPWFRRYGGNVTTAVTAIPAVDVPIP